MSAAMETLLVVLMPRRSRRGRDPFQATLYGRL
jgi:hypothetical protein